MGVLYQQSLNFIESIDTSNPVVNGMHNIKYLPYGLKDKIATKLIDVFYAKKIKPEGLELIEFNINQFKTIVTNPNSIN